jgi:hypothetical protein
MQKWEYMREFQDDMGGPDTAEMLRVLGQQGWELSAVGQMEPSNLWVFWFKRPVKTDADG